MLVEFEELKFTDLAFQTCTRQVTPRSPDFLYDEGPETFKRSQHRCGDHFRRIIFPERGRYQKQFSHIIPLYLL